MDAKDAYIQKLEQTVQTLEQQIHSLTEMILLLRKGKFGSSSEKTPRQGASDQLSLFNEAELEADPDLPEPIIKDGSHFKRRKPKTKREEILRDLPVKEVLCEIPEEDQYCEQCGTTLKPIGKETVREEVEYIPAKLQIIRYVRMSYECPPCKHTDTPYIEKSLTPSSLMHHSLASPSSVANVMYQKYVNHMPLNRQEKDWEQLGFTLSRATMANWVIRCAEDYLDPVIQYLRKQLIQQDVVHCDETPLQVLKEAGRRPQTKSYMWLYRSEATGEHPIILYDYKSSRSGENASEYLKGFKGYLHCDGYAGYNKIENVIRCGCWAHVRRKFVEAIPGNRVPGAAPTKAEIGRDYCNQLFTIEEKLSELPSKDRHTKRLELARPVLDVFWSWLNSLQTLPNSALGKAVTYAKNQKQYMENYLLDGRCSISNNAAENSIRPFALGRKNWLFADTPKGASASASVYSIVETAKANGLNVYAYLYHLLLYMPSTDYRNHPEELEELMPWSRQVQDECKG